MNAMKDRPLKAQVGKLAGGLGGRRVLVVGDVLADEYIIGRPERISREAPVLILEQERRFIVPGGAGNTAHAIRALGGDVTLLGVIGDDAVGRDLSAALAECNIDAGGMFVNGQRPTGVKTRVMAGDRQALRQQVVRIDRTSKEPVSNATADRLLARLQAALNWADVVVISDYGSGTVTDRVMRQTIAECRERDVPVIADTRYNLLALQGVTVLTPSQPELEAALGYPLSDDDALHQAGVELLHKLGSRALLLTRGALGMCLFEADGTITAIPATNPTEVFDVTGAGDTVTGTLAMAVAAGGTWLPSAVLSNIAAGIVVRKMGTRTVSPGELDAAVKAWVPDVVRIHSPGQTAHS